MKKQILTLFLLICLIVCLCACGDGDASGDGVTTGTPDAASAANTAGEDNADESSGKPDESAEKLSSYEKLFSNGPLPAQDTNELWGYIDDSGNWVIPPSFTYAGAFWDSGRAVVQEGEGQLFGVIDASGEYVVQPTFDNISTRMNDDLLRVRVPERGWGYIDSSGAFVIEPQFDDARDFCDGFARVSSQIETNVYGNYLYQLWGYIDTSGKRITEDIFEEAYDFSEGLACAKHGTYNYIDTEGNVAIRGYFDRVTSFSSGRAFVRQGGVQASDPIWGMIDAEGNWVIDESDLGGEWFDISTGGDYKVYWNNGLTPVRLPDGTGYVYINKDGERVLPKSGVPYAYAYDFTFDGLAAVRDAEMRVGYIDLDGNWVIPPQYGWSGNSSFHNGYAVVETDPGQTAILDISGNILITLDGDIQYGSLWTLERILVRHYGNDGTVKSKYYSTDGQLAIDRVFDMANTFAHDYSYAKVQYEGLWGFIDKDGNWLIPAKFLSFDRSVLLF